MEFALSLNIDSLPVFGSSGREVKSIFDRLSVDYHFRNLEKKGWIVWIGDYVLPDGYHSMNDFLKDLLVNFNVEKILKTGGYFYCVRFSDETTSIEVFTGFLNILPVYYYSAKEKVYIASKPEYITENVDREFGVNKRFILEKLLFNYPFKNTVVYRDIQMLSGNHYLRIEKTGLMEIKHTDMLDWIVREPVPVGKAKDYLTDILNNRFDVYMPDEAFHLSFTGGFDGRTILSRALVKNKKFTAYSFGTKTSPDVTIPLEQSKNLGINFHPFYLDDEIYIRKSLEYGLELVEETSSLSNFARAHYVFAAKQISKTNKYILTGNFGSELFRAFHMTGVMVTPFLFQLFNTGNIKHFLETYSYPELSALNPDNFKEELLSLKEDILVTKWFSKSGFTKNQLFYKYVFEEIFRKYFGAEIIMQSKYLYNRTPYLDYTLIKEIMKTKLAGVYSDFYENNPAKRLKGQLLYALCIKKNSTQLYNMKTGKGYSPKSIVNPAGKLFLLLNLIKKKVSKNKQQGDDFGVLKTFNFNKDYFSGMQFDGNLFKKPDFETVAFNEKNDLNTLINTISLNWYITKHFGKNE